MAVTDTAGKKTKERKLLRYFRGESSADLQVRAPLDVTHVIFEYADNTQTEVDLSKFFPGGQLPAPCVGRAAAAFGVNTSAGNAGTTVTGDDGEPQAPARPKSARQSKIASIGSKLGSGKPKARAAARASQSYVMRSSPTAKPRAPQPTSSRLRTS